MPVFVHNFSKADGIFQANQRFFLQPNALELLRIYATLSLGYFNICFYSIISKASSRSMTLAVASVGQACFSGMALLTILLMVEILLASLAREGRFVRGKLQADSMGNILRENGVRLGLRLVLWIGLSFAIVLAYRLTAFELYLPSEYIPSVRILDFDYYKTLVIDKVQQSNIYYSLGTRIVVMRDGVIQQIDTPLGLYNYPASLFVAGFIGSPQMNFFEAVFEDGSLKIGDHTFPLNGDQVKALTEGGYAGKSITMGIRPGDIHEGTAAGAAILATVELVERLGSGTFLYLSIAGTPCVAEVSPDSAEQVGDRVEVSLDMGKVHLFDGETEMRIEGRE